MPLTILADDLTGACDTGVLFAGRGRVGVLAERVLTESRTEVAAVDTESRALLPIEAAARVRATVKRLAARLEAGRVFKKIDSTLRGAVGAELDAALDSLGMDTALICPAFPDQQRTVTHGVLRVSGVPAHESPIARDRSYLGPASDIVQILRRDVRRPVIRLPLDEVRAGTDRLRGALERGAGHIIAADAENDADLDALARAAADHPSLLMAGSAGLGRAVAATLGYGGALSPLPDGRAWLIVAGSLHPTTRSQLEALEAAGVPGAWVDGRNAARPEAVVKALQSGQPAFVATRPPKPHAPPSSHAERASELASLAAGVMARASVDLVAVTGGETAYALLVALGARRLELLGVPASGLSLGELELHGGSMLRLLTKAGGFGRPDLFLSLLGWSSA